MERKSGSFWRLGKMMPHVQLPDSGTMKNILPEHLKGTQALIEGESQSVRQ
jgi:hypothetical protein